MTIREVILAIRSDNENISLTDIVNVNTKDGLIILESRSARQLTTVINNYHLDIVSKTTDAVTKVTTLVTSLIDYKNMSIEEVVNDLKYKYFILQSESQQSFRIRLYGKKEAEILANKYFLDLTKFEDVGYDYLYDAKKSVSN